MRWLAVPAAIILLCYPVVVYFGSDWLEPRILSLLIVSLWLVRTIVMAKSKVQRSLIIIACCLAALLLWQLNSERLLLFLPAIINLMLAAFFSYTLIVRPTLPARMAARSFEGELPPAVLRYTTAVTCVWIGFFLLNASVATWTALGASREAWVLYNGLIAYFLVAALFAAEYGYRRLVYMKRHGL